MSKSVDFHYIKSTLFDIIHVSREKSQKLIKYAARLFHKTEYILLVHILMINLVHFHHNSL